MNVNLDDFLKKETQAQIIYVKKPLTLGVCRITKQNNIFILCCDINIKFKHNRSLTSTSAFEGSGS